MTKIKALIEQRKHKRFKVKKGVYAVPVSGPNWLGHIKNICKSGLSFVYLDNEKRPNGSSELDIFFPSSSFSLCKVPFKSIYDFEITSEFSRSSIKKRQHGVQFDSLTSNKKSQLEYFIQNHTIGV